jgi:hypothetical protein
MKIRSFTLHVLTVASALMAFSSLASAQSTRTWVSGVGDDANPCSRTAPCKTYAGAISKTAAGGEIDCLDPGGFGAVTITKSITIDCHSGTGGVLVSGTNGIVIAAGANDTITLRFLAINGLGTGVNGIQINSAKTVHIYDVQIYGFTQGGVNATPSTSVFLSMQDVKISECGNGFVNNSTAPQATTAELTNVSILNTGSAILAQNGSRIVVHDSTFLGNNVAVNQNTLNGTGSVVTVFRSSLMGNSTGFQSIAGASIAASANVIVNSATVFNSNGGSIFTGNDNFAFSDSALGTANGGTITKI